MSPEHVINLGFFLHKSSLFYQAKLEFNIKGTYEENNYTYKKF